MISILNYISGQWMPSLSGQTMNSVNPATGQVLARLPVSNSQDVAFAAQEAQKAFLSWSKTSIDERIYLLNKVADVIQSCRQSLATEESMDNGKPVSLAYEVDIPRSEFNFRFFSQILRAHHGESFRQGISTLSWTDYQPLGPVTCISPWNLPLYLLTWKIAPALAAGCTVVAKPSEVTPLTAFRLSEIMHQVGFPKGVVNFVHGPGAPIGPALVQHPNIKAVSFTGSTQTGRVISQLAASSFKKLSLEMGGKNPTLIFSSVNLDQVIPQVIRSSFRNQGQICLCGSRILIERSIYSEFKTRFVNAVSHLKVADPMDPSADLGAIASEVQFSKIMGYIKTAKEEGGKIVYGGVPLNPNAMDGFFISPTVIEGLPMDSCVNQDEIFGPLVTLTPFDSEDEALHLANQSRYGLACSVWTQDLDQAHRVARQIEVGIVWINTWMNRDLRTPFGGVKESGYGREGGLDAMKFFSDVKTICIETRGS